MDKQKLQNLLPEGLERKSGADFGKPLGAALRKLESETVPAETTARGKAVHCDSSNEPARRRMKAFPIDHGGWCVQQARLQSGRDVAGSHRSSISWTWTSRPA